ncbi:hypothetical protein [Lysobacter capsici]|uniref:hypothetical protein n=1 Tax=Lysobacter capsici TaxID=435897 RepID=UPI00287BBC36|nr:hypothetical protein [Lysobacter capsici]WND81131.1 hypothetical protein RJ610_01765 [Lysobacter capsici]WND86327.1 hypothetical protein RJ609_01765 [Lysobacter capsici]
MANLLPTIASLWARELLREYHQMVTNQLSHGNLSRSLRKHAIFFAHIAEHFVSRDELSGVQIVRRLGHEFAAHHASAMSFLTVAGYIHTHEDPDYELEWHLSRIQALTQAVPAWGTAVLGRFLDRMLRRRDRISDRKVRRRIPMRPKSIESAMRCAADLITFANKQGASSVHELNQDMLELYVGEVFYRRFGIRAFVRHLRKYERTFGKLKVPDVKQHFHLKYVLTESKRTELLATFDTPFETQRDLRWAPVALFALIYLQPPFRSVAMRTSQVRDDGETIQIRFAASWLDLDPITAAALRRWMEAYRMHSRFHEFDDNPWLFPGRHAGNHIRALTFNPWLRDYGVSTRQLVQTAIVSWVRRGVKNPRVLVDAFGLSKVTAATYCEQLAMNSTEESRYAFGKRR